MVGLDVWNGSQSAVESYAKGSGRNITYPLALNASQVAATWGNIDRSSFAIVDTEGKIAFITSNAIPYFNRYATYKEAIFSTLDELVTTGVEQTSNETPAGFQLYQNRPNPFTSTTTVRFSLEPGARAQATKLIVYDLLGREISILASGQLSAGAYSVSWDGRNSKGFLMPPGIYFLTLESGTKREVKRLVFMRK